MLDELRGAEIHQHVRIITVAVAEEHDDAIVVFDTFSLDFTFVPRVIKVGDKPFVHTNSEMSTCFVVEVFFPFVGAAILAM